MATPISQDSEPYVKPLGVLMTLTAVRVVVGSVISVMWSMQTLT
jgi:hypothetical protein